MNKFMNSQIVTRDLTKQAPHSPRERIAGFVIVTRAVDKCRASLAGTLGDYHFDCPLDNMLFTFKGITGEQFKDAVKASTTYEDYRRRVDCNPTARPKPRPKSKHCRTRGKPTVPCVIRTSARASSTTVPGSCSTPKRTPRLTGLRRTTAPASAARPCSRRWPSDDVPRQNQSSELDSPESSPSGWAAISFTKRPCRPRSSSCSSRGWKAACW